MTKAAPLLEVQDLQTFFHAEGTVARAVDGVSFTVGAGETLAIVGESGSGKSVTSLSIMRLVPIPPGEIAGGRVLFRGRDLLALPEPEMRRIRGNEIGMIFQEPMSSLNPLLTVGEQIAEVVRLHQRLGRDAARQRAVEMLARVNIPDPERRAREYPHRLSGGMRQRVMIAMALACRPALLIADEPTTALDVTIQAQILHLIRALADRDEHERAVHHPQSRRGGADRRSGRGDVCRTHRRAGRRRARCSPRHCIRIHAPCFAASPVWRPSAAIRRAACCRSRARCRAPSHCRPAVATRRAARSPTRCAAPRCHHSPRSSPGMMCAATTGMRRA